MKKIVIRRHFDPRRIGLAAACVLFLGIFASSCWSGCGDEKGLPGMTAEEALSLGEKMYRNGILPSGELMKAATPGGVQARGTTFACVGCHKRSGLGSREEGIHTLPINGEKLFQPQYSTFPDLTPSERETLLPEKYQGPPLRESYTHDTLGAAIREGLNPSGRRFNPIMPKYQLIDGDLKILICYLANLSSKPSPGVTEKSMAFATVISDDVSQEDRQAMLKILEGYIRSHNSIGGTQGKMSRTLPSQAMSLGYRDWSLAVWIVKGPPETWQDQLQEYYSKEPVFAMLGGLSNGSWEPIHRFCETQRIPCILPITELPVVSSTDYYTLYFSKGYYQEGEAAARYLNNTAESGNPRDIVQVVGPSLHAKSLARGFEETWKGMGQKPIETITLSDHAPLGGEILSRLVLERKNRDLLLWTGPESYDDLKALAALSDKPATVFMSSSLLEVRLWDLPAEARRFTLVTYPWREPGEKAVAPPMGGRPLVVNKEFRKNDRRIASRTETITDFLTSVLPMLGRNFYRDYLFDLIDQMEDRDITDYEKLSFGPGKRYASEGCYIMQLSKDQNPTLMPKSEWIQH